MTAEWQEHNELHNLLRSMEEEGVTAGNVDRIDTLVRNDVESLRSYVEYMRLVSDLHLGVTDCHIEATLACVFGTDDLNSEDRQGRNPRIRTQEISPLSTRQVSPISVQGFPTTTIHGASGYFSESWLVAYLIATVIFGIGAVIGSITYVSHHVQIAGRLPGVVGNRLASEPQVEFVGRVTGMVDCQWVDPETEAFIGVNVPLGRKYALASGLMEITYETGAKVVLQGPLTYEVESKNGGFLSDGKLTGKVDVETAKGFSVRTPTAVVTDLGTEFGVEVNGSTAMLIQVFRGTVEVQPIQDEKPFGRAIQLNESESAQVKRDGEGKTLTIHRNVVAPQAFVRQLPQPPRVIDLLDIVAGGDGRGHSRERGINPTNGMEEPMCVFKGDHYYSDGKYHRPPYFKLIDGVFIPDGSRGPVQLDSAGHTFNLPKTLGLTPSPIWARAAVDVRPESLKKDTNHWSHCVTFGIDIMPDQRGLLAMHSNVGITFNLKAIRKAYGGQQFDRFRATAGNDRNTPPDLWVFVDGRLAWKSLHINAKSGVQFVDVAIGPEDRFLTLVSTDGGSGVIGGAWTVFGDPVLETAASEEGTRKEGSL